MSRYAINSSPALSVLVLLLVDIPSIAHGNEQPIQADVYNALYEAYVQCDDNLDQKRSEFITEKLERDGGTGMSIELLRKLFTHNVQIANQSIGEQAQERELYVSEMLRAPKVSSEESVEEAKASKERHEKIRQIDFFLKREKRYVEIHECVLSVL